MQGRAHAHRRHRIATAVCHCMSLQVYFTSLNASAATNADAVVTTANQQQDFRTQVHDSFRALQVSETSDFGAR
jgi:hypothetical protein